MMILLQSLINYYKKNSHKKKKKKLFFGEKRIKHYAKKIKGNIKIEINQIKKDNYYKIYDHIIFLFQINI